MSKIRNIVGRMIREEDGLETVEYAVMTALIVAGIVTAIGLIVTAIKTRFSTVAKVVASVPS